MIGRVQVISYNDDFSQSADTFYAMDREVYIRYGDEVSYSDRERTSYDGWFEFPLLHRGDYEIYVYSEDSSFQNPSEDDIAVVRSFTIEEKNELVDLGTITVINNDADGRARIRGKIKVMNYNSDFTTLLEEYYASDEEVFLQAVDGWGYSARVRTAHDGSFEFDELFPGEYEVYVYGDDSTGQSPNGTIPMIAEVEITGKDQIVEIGDLIQVD